VTAPLAADRALLDRYLPGLDGKLAASVLADLERPASPAIGWFRECGGPGLFVPTDFGGHEVSLADGVRLQRALGSRSPSLAVAVTMHHFSIATLIEWDRQGAGLEWLLAEAVARRSLLVASGVAESSAGSGVLSPQMAGRRTDRGILVTGSKKPCSLSRSMDLLFATVRLEDADPPRCALAVVAADSPGITRHPFWGTDVLAGAESDEVRLTDVFVPARLVADVGAVGETTDALRGAFVWFEVLMSAAYLGIAAGLLERVAAADRVAPATVAELVVDVEGATLALQSVAARVDEGSAHDHLGPALAARFLTQDAIVRVTARALEALGGGAFIRQPELAYLNSAARCLAFHPPARHAAAGPLHAYARGEPVMLS
jgi:alkylation response protein AidB-like acyl-CoA dehydrogenase